MSMISEQIKKFRYFSLDNEIDMLGVRELQMLLEEAADTIEELSAKLASANMERSTAYYNDGWIPVSERLPEYDFTNVLVCLKDKRLGCESDYFFTEAYRCRGMWILEFDAKMDNLDVVAWRELPAPYKPKGEK